MLSFRQTRHWHDSVSLWTRSLAVQPNSAVEFTNMGVAAREVGDFDNTRRYLELAIRQDPAFGEARVHYGREMLRKGDPIAAEKHLAKAVELLQGSGYRDDRYAGAVNNLVSACLEQGKLAEAERWARELVTARPEFSSAHFNLAAVLVQLGRLDEAERELRETLRLRPEDVQAARLLQDIGRD